MKLKSENRSSSFSKRSSTTLHTLLEIKVFKQHFQKVYDEKMCDFVMDDFNIEKSI